LTDSVPNNI